MLNETLLPRAIDRENKIIQVGTIERERNDQRTACPKIKSPRSKVFKLPTFRESSNIQSTHSRPLSGLSAGMFVEITCKLESSQPQCCPAGGVRDYGDLSRVPICMEFILVDAGIHR